MKTVAAIVSFLASIGMAVAGGSNTTLIVQWNGTNFVTRYRRAETIIGSSGVFVNTNGLGGVGDGYYCMSNGQWTVFVPGAGGSSVSTNGLAPVTYVDAATNTLMAHVNSVSNMVTDGSRFFAYLSGTNLNLTATVYYQQFYSGILANVGNIYTNGVFTPNSTGKWTITYTVFARQLDPSRFLDTTLGHSPTPSQTNYYGRWDPNAGMSEYAITSLTMPFYVNSTSETFRLFVRHDDPENDVDVLGGNTPLAPFTTWYYSWFAAWKDHQ